MLSFLCYSIDFLDCGTFHCAPNANLCSAIVYADDLTKLVFFAWFDRLAPQDNQIQSKRI